MMSPRKRLFWSLMVLIAVFLVGTAGYLVVEADQHPTVLEAAYMTAITLSTVGFTEVWPLGPAGRLWTMGVIFFGIGAVSVSFSSLITLFISGELRLSHEKRKMDHAIQQLRNHVIVCGYGRIGSLVLAELRRRGVPVVAVELRRDLEVDLRDTHIPFIIGDATDETVLLRAGIMHARAVVVTLPHDADNVYITLTVHALCPDLFIVARAEQSATETKLRRAGASRVVSPQVVGATIIANVLTRPNVVEFLAMADRGVDLEMDEYAVTADSPMRGRKLRESGLRGKTGAMVVAIKRADGQTLYSPDAEAVFEAGDTLIIVGPTGVSSRLDKMDA